MAMRKSLIVFLSVVSLGSTLLVAHSLFAKPTTMQDRTADRQRAEKLMKDQNFAEALEVYRTLALDETNSDEKLPDDFSKAVQCMSHLGQLKEVDEFLESVVDRHATHWPLLHQAALVLSQQIPPQGYLIGGKFERGHHRGGGKVVNSVERDRVRSIQLLQQAIALLEKDDAAKYDVYQLLADNIGRYR